MKAKCNLLIIVFLLINTLNVFGQQDSLLNKNYFQLTPRVGFDLPTYENNTPYIDYKGGLDLGLSLDYYWSWFGLGVDFDYIKNSPESIYPTTGLNSFSGTFSDFNLIEDGITRMFYGIGPNFQYRGKSGRFTAELNTRAGLASIDGGRTLLEGSTTGTTPFQLLNYHAGYDASNVLSFKGQLRFTYWLTNHFGINAGAYYLHHFGVEEGSDSGISAAYQPFIDDQGELFIGDDNVLLREDPCDCDIFSVGAFAGLTFIFGKKEDQCPVCELDHSPHCCVTCGCGITVTARDKFTGEILPNTDIILENLQGEIIKTGTTNAYGTVVFEDVGENNYVIKGKLHNIDLEESSISKSDFKDCKQDGSAINKEILYTDENFILDGNVVECNTTTGIQGVDVILKNKIIAGQKNTLSNADGNFTFHLNQSSTYGLNGRKDGYFSNEVEVNTSTYNRNSSLFIDFEMCIDPCGKAIKLDNINFDLDMAVILPEAKPDLDYVVKLMQENPDITVEMSSHTDSQGSDEYNQNLSQLRADATVNYIVSKGIERDRLIARGAGETELKNTKCGNNVPCTDEEHRINRRTEFKVVCF